MHDFFQILFSRAGFSWQNICRGLCLAVCACIMPAFTCPSSVQAAPSLSQAQASLFTSANKAYQAGDGGKTIQLLQREMEHESPHPYACMLYGLGLMKLEKPQQAAEAFSKGLRQTPDDADLQHNYGLALMQSKQYAKAAVAFADLAAKSATQERNTFLYLTGQCHYFALSFNKALQTMAPLADSPKAAKEWIKLAAVSALQCKQWKQAEHFFTLAVRRYPKEREYWKGLAHARYQQGNKAGTIAALEVASRLRSSRSQQEQQELAGLYLQASAPLLSFNKVSSLPETQDLRQTRLHCLERAGRHGRVVEYIDILLTKEPSADLYLRKGQALYRDKKPFKALDAFIQGAGFSGEEAERCAILAGMIAWENGHTDTATRMFTALGKASRFQTEARQALAALQSIQALRDELEILPTESVATASW